MKQLKLLLLFTLFSAFAFGQSTTPPGGTVQASTAQWFMNSSEAKQRFFLRAGASGIAASYYELVTAPAMRDSLNNKLSLTGGNLTGLLTTSNSINSTPGNFIGINVGNGNSAALSVAGMELSSSGFSYRLYASASPTHSTVLRFGNTDGVIATLNDIENPINIYLPNTTTSNTGIVFKNGNRFIHNYNPPSGIGRNIFIGQNSGNFTMTASVPDSASNNVGIGDDVFSKLGHGYVNTAIGSGAMKEARHSNGEVAVGYNALSSDQDGIHNVAIGYSALSSTAGDQAFTYGLENTAIGFFAGANNITGRQNIFIGSNSGSSMGNKSDAINSMALGVNVSISADNTYYYGNGLVTNHIFAGDQTWYGARTTGLTGSGNIVLNNSPSFVGTVNGQDLILGGKMSWGTGVYSAGISQIFNTSSSGTILVPKTGAFTDFKLSNGVGATVFDVPAGTQDINFNAKATVSTPPTNPTDVVRLTDLSTYAPVSTTVTTNTTQAISGQKTFSAGMSITGGNTLTAYNGSIGNYPQAIFGAGVVTTSVSLGNALTYSGYGLTKYVNNFTQTYNYPASLSASGDISFPAGTGTLALTSNLSNYAASGDGSTTSITIPHGKTGILITSAVVATPRNAASAGISYVTIDATNVTIVYTVAPTSGTNNLSYSIHITP